MSTSNNQRLAKNTIYLYFRTMIVMAISIYTSRIVLDVLGVEDYGIYNVVGGFVSMFAILSGTLTAASQRYIAYELGSENGNVSKIFSTTVSIHIILAIIILILLESFGIWFVNNKLNISPDRITAANWVFQCSVFTFCINIISIPYNAAIIAYEKMAAFAYISILEVIFKLLVVFTIGLFAFDKLVTYAILMMVVAVLLRLVYGAYCGHNCPGCRYRPYLEKSTFREMLGFCGWNFIGSSSAVLNNQGINMLINVFFGVSLNAARGIATQVDNAINSFVQNFMMALNPQITKSYASKDYEYVNNVIIRGTKLSFFLFWFICLPVLINTDYILSIWLKKVPLYTSVFIKLGLLYNMCQNLSQCLYTTMLATGNIKKYQLIVGGLSLLAFPFAWIMFRLGLSAEWGYWTVIIISIICLIARLILLQDMVPMFRATTFIIKAILPILCVVIVSSLLALCVHGRLGVIDGSTFVLESILYVLISSLSIFYLGLNANEREYCINKIKQKIHK